jgi:hypothetical protein
VNTAHTGRIAFGVFFRAKLGGAIQQRFSRKSWGNSPQAEQKDRSS